VHPLAAKMTAYHRAYLRGPNAEAVRATKGSFQDPH
jgi:hypothetical protein